VIPASHNRLIYFVIACVVAVDQITKAVARPLLGEGGKVVVIPGFFDLRLSYNTGAAFGVLPGAAPLFIVIALAAIYAAVRARAMGPQSRLFVVGIGLLIGGAAGNLIDRLLAPDHRVTDFLDFHIGSRYWPTFNVADAAIVVGVILVFASVFILGRSHESERY
jgi:signal peptidase II